MKTTLFLTLSLLIVASCSPNEEKYVSNLVEFIEDNRGKPMNFTIDLPYIVNDSVLQIHI